MKKLILSLCLLLGLGLVAQGQVLRTIADIQTPVNLAACNDSSIYVGDTVIVRGTLVVDGGLAQAVSGRNVWIQDGVGPWNGLDVFGQTGVATTPDDILNLLAGDSVEITGFIDEFQGETEIRPLNVTLLGFGNPLVTAVDIAELNDAAQNNILTTGEKYEGLFCEFDSVTVTAVVLFAGGTRVSFNVADAAGNKMNVSDRFIAQRLPANGGTFVPPNVNDFYCSLKGVLLHSKNNCPGSNGRGYELHPFDASHYVVCSACPSISNITRNLVTPNDAQTVTVSATITDNDGVASATLYYHVGISNPPAASYTAVPMTNPVGNTWQGVIPALGDGSFVKYFIEATDNNAATCANPNVDGGSDPLFYTVRNAGTTIYDVQFVPNSFSNGNSGYTGLDVTVTGVVTGSAEAGNLGYVFIQQEGQLSWAGLMLLGNPTLSTLTIGQKVQVSGTIEEDFNMTRMNPVNSISVIGTGNITPLNLNPSIFSTYDFATNEMYEAMLINLTNPGNPLYVVNQNPDAPSNFAEWRLGADQFDPNAGCRVISGRQTASAFSSLNVSYVNDSMWTTTNGVMNVPPCIVYDGMQLTSLTGIIYYSFSAMKIMPRNNNDTPGGPCLTSVNSAMENLANVSVYPNPVSGIATIKYDFGSAQTGAKIEIMDLTGRAIRTIPIAEQSGTISLETGNIPAGAYLLSIVSENNGLLHSQKLLVIK